jgi:hypothetical protein
MKKRILVAVCLIVLSTAHGLGLVLAVQEDDLLGELEEAKALYLQGNFPRAVEALTLVIQALKVRSDLEELKSILCDAHFYLGLTYYALHDQDSAKESFRAVIRLVPDYRVDPAIYAPRVVSLFEDARREVDVERKTRVPEPPRSEKAKVPDESTAPEPEQKSSRLPWMLLGIGGAGAAGAALALRDRENPDFQLSCSPSQLNIDLANVYSTCTITSKGSFSGMVGLSCSDTSPVPCQFESTTVAVSENTSVERLLLLPVTFTAPEGMYHVEVIGTGGGLTRTATLQVGVSSTCSGFVEQPSYTGDCGNRPEGSICWGFSDGYTWLAQNDGFGAPGYSLGPCEGKTISVAVGFFYEYHHVLGTLLVKRLPRTR